MRRLLTGGREEREKDRDRDRETGEKARGSGRRGNGLENARSRPQAAPCGRLPPLHRSPAGCAGGRFRRPCLPTQALSQRSLEHSTYQKKPRAVEGAGRLGVCTRGGGEQSLGRRLCQQGAAGGGWGRDRPSLCKLLPWPDSPRLEWRGGQREREQRLPWVLLEGLSSVIRDALGSQLLLHPGQVGGVRVPKPGSKEK